MRTRDSPVPSSIPAYTTPAVTTQAVTNAVDKDWMMQVFQPNTDNKMDQMMGNMSKMFQMSHADSMRREVEQDERFNTALRIQEERSQESFRIRDAESKIIARDQLAVTSQLDHLTTTVSQLRKQLSDQQDFTVDAMQQIRDEVTASQKDAVNAGGDSAQEAGQSPPTLGNQQRERSDTKIPGQQYVTCEYCDGQLPKVIALQCHDCEAFSMRTI